MQSVFRTLRQSLRSIKRNNTYFKSLSTSIKDIPIVNIPNKEDLTEEEMDKIQNNPYFNKYSKKLKDLQKLIIHC